MCQFCPYFKKLVNFVPWFLKSSQFYPLKLTWLFIKLTWFLKLRIGIDTIMYKDEIEIAPIVQGPKALFVLKCNIDL